MVDRSAAEGSAEAAAEVEITPGCSPASRSAAAVEEEEDVTAGAGGFKREDTGSIVVSLEVGSVEVASNMT